MKLFSPSAKSQAESTGLHDVLGTPIHPPFPEGLRQATIAMGCFWGAERKFWQHEGVYTTAVGYSGGTTKNPGYREVCRGTTGHAESVLVVHDPEVFSLEELLGLFFEAHDPTQGMRQGNDVGPQYRSAIFVEGTEEKTCAESVRDRYQAALDEAGRGKITTEITALGPFWYAEEYHQQYLSKNPGGYCGLGGTGVACPI